MNMSTSNPASNSFETPQIEEALHLDHCLAQIDRNLAIANARLGEYQREIQAAHDHMWDARRDMDHIDKAALRQSIDQMMRSSDVMREQQVKLRKLRASPYFARFDFRRSDSHQESTHYIGVHDFRDEDGGEHLVYDWRAPVSSLFYDFETGPAFYEAPSGRIEGEITRKRQFRIRKGKMELLIESAINIIDDVLQDELARSSEEGMKTIVATIQRDQNAIIRDAEAHTLIIQGVAGSGKTSIALHRIAFLLYRFKETISSDDILIISPNRVFADYIGNVLPELGEHPVPEIGMDRLAAELLDDIRFQTFFEQTADVLEKQDPEAIARIKAKANLDLLRELDQYAKYLEQTSFTPTDCEIRRRPVPGFLFEREWKRYANLAPGARRSATANSVIEEVENQYRIELRKEERAVIRTALAAMINRPTLRQAYKGFYEWNGRPELLRVGGGKIEYADVFPLIYLKLLTEGIENPWPGVQHLLIDEMQDYTPVQYAVLSRLFPCGKTVLGDSGQSVNPHSASRPEDITKVLKGATLVTLNKSYRSTYEIMQFALQVSPNPDLVAMRRHGEAPRVIACRNSNEHLAVIQAEIATFTASDHRSMAIIAKTQTQARKLFRQLAEAGTAAKLLDNDSEGFSTGVLICAAQLAKGLEFDRVVIAGADDKNYHTNMDRNLLYIGCTRAMHRLSLVSHGDPSRFIRAAGDRECLGHRGPKDQG
ncbi:HelD family protein [Alteraurantiacibacter palmitatis]|uniref:HelD family protein n=1 Tax=Alteraurantiacibacter palmitatis TaxID=2054628 RepID=A0ABV7E2V6_9SPHN